MTRLYSVDDLAAACKTTPRTVRLYMKKGLLEPQRAGRTYVFTEDCVTMLKGVMRAKRLGFSLKELKLRKEQPTADLLQEMLARIECLEKEAKEEIKVLKQELKSVKRSSS